MAGSFGVVVGKAVDDESAMIHLSPVIAHPDTEKRAIVEVFVPPRILT